MTARYKLRFRVADRWRAWWWNFRRPVRMYPPVQIVRQPLRRPPGRFYDGVALGWTEE